MRIAVLGAGNMGRWLIRELAADHEICVHDPLSSRTEGLERVVIAPGWTGSPRSARTFSSTRSA